MVVILKVELEENKRTHEELEAQLVLKTEENNKLEEEVIGLKTQMEKLSQKLNAYQGSSKLNEILNAQRPPHLKFGLGFEGESSSKQVKEAPQKTKQIAVNVTPPKAISQTQKPKRKLAPPKKMPQPQNFRPPMRIQSTNFRSIRLQVLKLWPGQQDNSASLRLLFFCDQAASRIMSFRARKRKVLVLRKVAECCFGKIEERFEAIPGILLASVLSLDHQKSRDSLSPTDASFSKGHKYIWFALAGHAIGLVTALTAGILAHSLQPALLYLFKCYSYQTRKYYGLHCSVKTLVTFGEEPGSMQQIS
ncbi:hypothetical protein MRB53_032351 [Persea americana]|uniref:Uncharacterized protein n=1 Tax=Persea americana TaxID=3435 RepID=A0ACC2KRN6_PERAE|nr:hypothetical protein MRB53_032351 [Persea americana]